VSEDKVQVLNAMVHHRTMVQVALQTVTQALERRSLAHDVSKFGADEFEGFSRINRTAREHPYGSAEYRAALKQEKSAIALHYARNSHHPEYWETPERRDRAAHMGLLDLIEMACDWWAAWKVYDGQRAPEDRSSWMENLDKQRKRFYTEALLSKEQWFVVEQMAHLLAHAHEWGGEEEGR
jgi:hypothetical protein